MNFIIKKRDIYLQLTLPQPTIVQSSESNVLFGSFANDIVVAHAAGLESLTRAISFANTFRENLGC